MHQFNVVDFTKFESFENVYPSLILTLFKYVVIEGEVMVNA